MNLNTLTIFPFSDSYLKSYLPPSRPPQAHKKSFGSLQICAGSLAYPGAAILAALGAFKAGCGYICLDTQAPIEILKNLPEIIPAFQSTADAFVVGPGFDPIFNSEHLKQLLEKIPQERPTLIDGGALRFIREIDLSARQYLVLTPHEGELAAILGDDWSAKKIQENRLSAVLAFAQRYPKVTLLLKGQASLVFSATHSGAFCEQDPKNTIFQLTHGSVAMASAGQGDVLAGVIGAYLALGLDPLRATLVGASLCALSAEELGHGGAPQGVLAHEVASQLPYTLKKISEHL